MELLALAVGITLIGFIALLGALILWNMARGRIDLARLISEPAPSGGASLSRFQFLVFTFVIALSYLLVVLGEATPKFPDVPPGVLALLGISSVSCMVSKGIQTSRDTQLEKLAGTQRVEVAQTLQVAEAQRTNGATPVGSHAG